MVLQQNPGGDVIEARMAAEPPRVEIPMVHRYLGDKRFAYALPRALSLQILHPGNAASLTQHVHTVCGRISAAPSARWSTSRTATATCAR